MPRCQIFIFCPRRTVPLLHWPNGAVAGEDLLQNHATRTSYTRGVTAESCSLTEDMYLCALAILTLRKQEATPKPWMPCGLYHKFAGQICLKRNFFLKCWLHWRVGFCPTILTPEAVKQLAKQSSGKMENTQPQQRHNHKMMIRWSDSLLCPG